MLDGLNCCNDLINIILCRNQSRAETQRVVKAWNRTVRGTHNHASLHTMGQHGLNQLP